MLPHIYMYHTWIHWSAETPSESTSWIVSRAGTASLVEVACDVNTETQRDREGETKTEGKCESRTEDKSTLISQNTKGCLYWAKKLGCKSHVVYLKHMLNKIYAWFDLQSPNTKFTVDLVLLSPGIFITLKKVLGFKVLNSGSLF